MPPRLLHLVSIDLDRDDVAQLHWLGAELTRRISVVTCQSPPPVLPPHPAGSARSSNDLIDALIAHHESLPDDEWLLALTASDLSIAGPRYVFGEATLGGPCALVSLARLREPASGDDTLIVRARLLREALHELGHLASLTHCDDPRCVMAPAQSLEEVDAREASYCASCGPLISNALDTATDRH